MSRHETLLHVRGESLFVGDLPRPADTLYAAVFTSSVAAGHLRALHVAEAQALPGVVAVLTARDIPGDNQLGEIIEDESLLAHAEVRFVGKPLALVVAESAAQARAALAHIRAEIEAVAPVFDTRQAAAQSSTFGPRREIRKGDLQAAWQRCHLIVSGQVHTGAQEHVYLETQRSLAIPLEDGGLKLWSATQSPSAVQKSAARVLGIDMHLIEVEVPRLGGGFGGKEEQAKPWAVLAALAAHHTRRPVYLELDRREDMRYTGKRHPYAADYRLGVATDGTLLAFEADFLQDGGAVADLSTAILERTLFHAGNAYAIEAMRISATSCRTAHPSNTAFRGFGAPQGIFTIEAALHHAADALGLPVEQLQRRNLVSAGYRFHYGQTLEHSSMAQVWDRLIARSDLAQRRAEVAAFNARERWQRKGLALMPVCFGISFTSTHLNQAGALLHIYEDGSLNLSASAVEMGQGVYSKLQQVAARALGISLARVRVEHTQTGRAANMSPTAASVGADLNGLAVLDACAQLRERLLDFAAAHTGHPRDQLALREDQLYAGDTAILDWPTLIHAARMARLDLSAHGFYRTPHIGYDRSLEQGHPFAYHVFGAALIEATVDCLRGTYHIDTADAVYDLGESLDPAVDRGQVEGGIVQGIGYATLEEIRWDAAGHLLTDDLARYKIPDLYTAPRVDVSLINGGQNPYGPFNSKAIGEPPFILGLGAWFAVRDALRAWSPQLALPFDLPLTAERVLMALEGLNPPASSP